MPHGTDDCLVHVSVLGGLSEEIVVRGKVRVNRLDWDDVKEGDTLLLDDLKGMVADLYAMKEQADNDEARAFLAREIESLVEEIENRIEIDTRIRIEGGAR